MADQADNKNKELFTKVTVPPMIFALVAILAFGFSIKHETVTPNLPTSLAPAKDSQRMYTALILEDIANMEPARLVAAGQIDEAIGEANKEMQEKPNDLETIMCVGNVLTEKGDKQRGIDLLKQTVVLAPNSRYVRINYARHLPLVARNDEAVKEYEYLCKNFPKQWLDPRIELAAIYVQLGKAQEAANLQKAILEVEPDNVSVKRDYALSQARTGQEEQGFESFSKLCQLPKEQQLYSDNCRVILKANNYISRKAVSQLKDDITLRQKQIRPRLALVELLLYLGRPKEAKEAAETAVKSGLKSAELEALLTEANVKLKDTEAAKESFKRAAELTFGKH